MLPKQRLMRDTGFTIQGCIMNESVNDLRNEQIDA